MAEATGVVYPIGENYDRYNEYGVNMSTLGPFQRYITDPDAYGDKRYQRQRIGNIASFIPFLGQKVAEARGDKLGEYLGFLDALGASTGAKLAISPFLIAKKEAAEKALKNFDTDPILSANPQMRKNLQAQIDEVNKEIDTEKIIQKRYDDIKKKYIPPKQGILNLDIPKGASFNQTIYHGGPAGLPSLKTPDFILDDMNNLTKSTGGIYTVLNRTDPRLGVFGANLDTQKVFDKLSPAIRQKLLKDLPQKSVYKIQPNFSNIADAEKLPATFIRDLEKQLEAIDFTKGNPYDLALNRNTANTLEQIITRPELGAPSMINKPVGDTFRKAGFDSVLFPPRPNMRGESETVLSLYDDLVQNFEPMKLEDLLRD